MIRDANDIAVVNGFASVVFGIGTFLGKILEILGTYAAGIGALMSICTFLVYWHYQRLNARREVRVNE